MIWIKSVLVGIAAAIVTIVVVVALVLATATWWVDVGGGGGSIGFVSFGITELLVVPVFLAFAFGFWWSVRRQRRTRELRNS